MQQHAMTRWGAAAVLAILLFAAAAHGALTCDANGDGRVTVDELVAGVNAMLSAPDCHEGCAGCAPDTCSEFLTGHLNGVCTLAVTEACWGDIDACLPIFCGAHPEQCHESPLCLDVQP